MYKTIGAAALVLALATGGAATLGGTALASSGLHDRVATASPPCIYIFYLWGMKIMMPCPSPANNGGTATNNCNANCSASATGTNGKTGH